MEDQVVYRVEERRNSARSRDSLYRIVQILNIASWCVFVAALVMFHYARPELITGLQLYWGVEGRADWSTSLSFYLVLLLGFCLLLAAITFVMRRMRSRRKHDFFGINLYFLLVLAISILSWVSLQLTGSG